MNTEIQNRTEGQIFILPARLPRTGDENEERKQTGPVKTACPQAFISWYNILSILAAVQKHSCSGTLKQFVIINILKEEPS